jgi:hypothetical protein
MRKKQPSTSMWLSGCLPIYYTELPPTLSNIFSQRQFFLLNKHLRPNKQSILEHFYLIFFTAGFSFKQTSLFHSKH